VIWIRSAALLVVGLLVAACSAAAAPTPLPTLTLIPPTASATTVPATVTQTPAGLPGPEDLVTPSPDSGPVLIPAAAQPLMQRALADLAEQLDIGEDEIQVLRFEAALWTSLDLGCDESEATIAAPLEIEGFRIVLAVEQRLYEYHSDDRSSLRLCAEAGSFAGTTQNLLLDTDPVAADMVALAQQRVAAELDLSTRRVLVVDVTAYTWPDSSLGCPQPGASYPSVAIEGYRIALSAGDAEYIFHTNATQMIACDSDLEVLPE
jgi:hypothetical protein